MLEAGMNLAVDTDRQKMLEEEGKALGLHGYSVTVSTLLTQSAYGQAFT